MEWLSRPYLTDPKLPLYWCMVSNYHSPVMVNWYLMILNTSSDLVVYANYNPSDCLMLSDHYIVCHSFIPTVRNIFATYKRPLESRWVPNGRTGSLYTFMYTFMYTFIYTFMLQTMNKQTPDFLYRKIMIPILKQKWLCFGKFYVENV